MKHEDFAINAVQDNQRILFNIPGHCDLIFDLVTRKSIEVMTNHLVKYEIVMINSFKEMSRNYLNILRMTLTFALLTTKSIVVIQVITNLYVKYEDFVLKAFQDNQ